MSSILSCQNVSKRYGLTEALKGVSLSLSKNSILALLGPNGAGKTTLLRSILNLVKIDIGLIKINGIQHTDPRVRMGMAYLPEKFFFYPYYSVKNVLSFMSELKEIDPLKKKEQIEKVLNLVKISDLAYRKVSKLSKGQLKRVALASALIGPSNFVLFDEPFADLDPIGIKELKDLILLLKKEGKTILINSHILSEIEKLADWVAIIDKGEIRHCGELKKIQETDNLESFFYKTIKREQ